MPATDPPPDAQQRRDAADVRYSVIVQAPAGSGKTTLLVDRLLNLLAIVERPEEILAITFTRKAAAEMRSRVVAALSEDDERAQTIRRRGETLGWRIDSLTARLRIQTIDAFCATLVRSLPIASRLGDALAVTTDVRPLYADAVRRAFERVDSDAPLSTELVRLLALFDNDYPRMHDALVAMLGRRDQWFELVAHVLRRAVRGRVDDGSGARAVGAEIDAAIEQLHRGAFDDIQADLDDTITNDLVRVAEERAARLQFDWRWGGLPDALDGWAFVADLLSTRDGKPRSRFGEAQGFASGSGAAREKAELKSLAAELDRRGLMEQLASIRQLPARRPRVDELADIDTVAAALAVLVVELGEAFRRAGAFDFAEVTFAALRALGDADSPTDLALALDYRIKHVLIDEFQDTSAIHYRLFSRLLQEWNVDDGRTLFVVGDPMQSIYRFRDADVGLFQRTRRRGIGSLRPRPIELVSNFRSSATLIAWINATFVEAFGGHEDPLLGRVAYAPSVQQRPSRPEDGCTMTVIASDAEAAIDEARHVADTIERIRSSHPEESIAVLVRNRAHLGQTIDALSDRRIPWRGVAIHPLATRPVVSDLLVLLKALSSDDDRAAWLALLRAPFVGLSMRDLESVAQLDRPARVVRDDVEIAELSHDGRARIARIRPVLRTAESWRGQARTRQWLESTFIRLGGADAYEGADAMEHARKLFELVERIHPRIVDIPATERALDDLFADDAPIPNAVELMTIHRAKGLEFDHVLVPCLHRINRRDDPPPIRWRPEGEHVLIGVDRVGTHSDLYRWLGYEDARRDANEVIRLMYVAATRARSSLHLSAVLGTDPQTGVRAPPARSLLATIWPTASKQARIISADTTEHGRAANTRRVLPSDYRWRRPQ